MTDLAFIPHGRALVSASLDGTVRAFDTMRFRNFQTFVSPEPAQFNCVAVDPSGEIVCAGSADTLLVYVWNVQTAQLLESLAGHEGPVSCLAFGDATSGTAFLASGSWDKTVRVWDFLSSKASVDTLTHASDVTALAFSPDGATLAVATLDGQVSVWDAKLAEQIAMIDGRPDVAGGKSSLSKAARVNDTSHFSSVAFSADGSAVLAGGQSKFVCLYDVASRVLLRKYVLSNNVSLDGVRMQLRSDSYGGGGHDDDLLLDGYDSDDASGMPPPARGVVRRSERITKLAIRASCVRFAPDGRSWAVASTEGLLVYAIDDALQFDPTGLELETTPAAVVEAAQSGDFGRALPMALCLNEPGLLRGCWQLVPPEHIPIVAQQVPAPYLERLLRFLGGELERSTHVHAVMLWVQQLLLAHGQQLRDRPVAFEAPLRALHKGTRLRYEELGHMCNRNLFSLDFLIDQHGQPAAEAESGEQGGDESGAGTAAA